jgi:murein tripeptide amidase MpaA
MKTLTINRWTEVIFVLWAAVLLAVPASAQEKREMTTSALKAMGAPNNPKVEVAWNRYYDSEELAQIMHRVERAYPHLAKVSSIGKSYKGKEMWLITVSNFENGDPDKKPAMYVDGNIHSNEIQGAEVALYTAWYVTEMYSSNDWIHKLLDEKTLYIVPTINPDARDHFIHEPNNPNSPRSGLVPRDDDGDGLIDEDTFDDLDGDGNITQMRIKDPNGRWVTDPDDPRMMVQAKQDQRGEYTLLGYEGIDNDGDGLVNEDGPGSYDPNRDWPWNWAPRYVQSGADHYPFTFPENRAVGEFVLAHQNIAAAQSFHNNGGMILRGPGSQNDLRTYSQQDLQTYDFLGKLGEEQLPGYRYIVIYKDLYTVFGGEIDWFYGARGIITFSNELWTNFDYFRPQKAAEAENPRDRSQLYRFDKILLFEEGIVPWKKFNHPQFGEIEIGGFKKAWTRTAPSFMMEDMLHRNMAFTLFDLYHTPQVQIDSAYTKSLSGGLTEVTAVVRNTRVIPTHTYQDSRNKITRPDWVTLEGGKVVSGSVLQNRFFGTAQEQKRHPERIDVENISGMGAVYVRWIVQGKGPFTITVDSEKGGRDSEKVR